MHFIYQCQLDVIMPALIIKLFALVQQVQDIDAFIQHLGPGAGIGHLIGKALPSHPDRTGSQPEDQAPL